MKRTLLIAILLLLCISTSSFAVPILPPDIIRDSYLHPNDVNSWQQEEDVIGDVNDFDIYGYRWRSNDVVDILEIYTSWSYGLDGKHLNAAWGDVFFYTGDPSSTSNVFAALALRSHGIGKEDKNIRGGNIFTPTSFLMSDDYFTNPRTFGDHEFVTAKTDDTDLPEIKLKSVQSSLDENVYIVIATFEKRTFGSSDIIGSQVRAQFTCANDVMATPEPSTFILIGFGLLGLLGYSRKRS